MPPRPNKKVVSGFCEKEPPDSKTDNRSRLQFFSFVELLMQGSGVGPWQLPAQSGSSSAGLGSWIGFSRPSAPEWYHERHAVTNVSQDPSPEAHCVSLFHSRPSPCSEFLKQSTPDPRNRKIASTPDPRALGWEVQRAGPLSR